MDAASSWTDSEPASPYWVDDWLGIYASHSHDHAALIREARAGYPSAPQRSP